MQATIRGAIALVALTLVVGSGISVEGTYAAGQPPTPPAAPGGGRGGPPTPRFPAHLRPADDPAAVERGRQVYGIACRACHGADLRGGDMGGPNLLRSDVMLNDLNGERLLPIVRGGRAAMPPVDLPADDVTAVAVYIHSVLATAKAQGAPPPGPALSLNVLVGDPAAGEVYFNATCASCHSTTGDLLGIGARVADPMQLQNLWVAGGRDDRIREPGDPPGRRDVLAVITPLSGPRVAGRLERIDDFTVTVVLADGVRRTFRRVEDVPKIEITDPLAAHRRLLETYTDRDMHNVTAFLVTLK
jgi:cytochrome c oxidase cbb3-type subunit 3